MGLYIQEFYIRQAVGVSYIFSDVLFCLCLMLVLNDRPWDKKSIWLKFVDFAATFAAMLLINSAAFRLRGSIQFVRLVALPILVAAHLPFGNRYDWPCRVVTGLTYYSSYVLILVIAAESVMTLRMFGLLAPKNGGFDMTTVLAIVMPGVMTVFLRRFSIASFRYRHRFTTVLILCMVVLTQLLQCLHMDAFYTSVSLLVFRVAANTVLWILELLAYYMLYVVTKEYNENLSLQAEKLRMEADRVLADFSEQNFTQLRNLRHDLRNQFAYMNALIEQGEYERLKGYFSALSRDAMVPLGYLDCGNNAINAILHFERTRAAANGVDISPRIVVPPELSIEEHDLCSLLSNLLDNAIEAAAQSETENVTVEVERYFLASYDYTNAKGYILSAGDYYLSVGDDAHDALNNILAAKGASGMVDVLGNAATGDAAKTYSWNQESLDTEAYRYSAATGAEVTNQFETADLNYWGDGAVTYLSRKDWAGTYPAPIAVVATAAMMKELDNQNYVKPADAKSVSEFNQGVDAGLTYIDMREVDYNDPLWETFLDQLTLEQMTSILPDQNGAAEVTEIALPASYRGDDMDCLEQATFKANGKSGIVWPSAVLLAAT